MPRALREIEKGGTVVCAGIHMTDVPAFPYALLWGERTIRSVANLTRRDGEEFLAIAPRIPVRTVIETFPSRKQTTRWSGSGRDACTAPPSCCRDAADRETAPRAPLGTMSSERFLQRFQPWLTNNRKSSIC